jgi:hypothetical protein
VVPESLRRPPRAPAAPSWIDWPVGSTGSSRCWRTKGESIGESLKSRSDAAAARSHPDSSCPGPPGRRAAARGEDSGPLLSRPTPIRIGLVNGTARIRPRFVWIRLVENWPARMVEQPRTNASSQLVRNPEEHGLDLTAHRSPSTSSVLAGQLAGEVSPGRDPRQVGGLGIEPVGITAAAPAGRPRRLRRAARSSGDPQHGMSALLPLGVAGAAGVMLGERRSELFGWDRLRARPMLGADADRPVDGARPGPGRHQDERRWVHRGVPSPVLAVVLRGRAGPPTGPGHRPLAFGRGFNAPPSPRSF